MKPEYQAYRDELLEKELSRYKLQRRGDISIPYLLKGKCYGWTAKFAEKFPQLKQVCGFYGNSEHYWCVDTDGTIVDPTVGQFYDGEGDPNKYRVFDESVDKIYLGKCMNCGFEIYGLKAEGEQSICKPEAGEKESECSRSLTDYYNGMLSASRGGY
jgi:hypothetical protein